MKIPRFLKTLMAILICIGFIRAANNAGSLSIKELLTDLKSLEFDFDAITDLINYFSDNNFSNEIYTWNDDLTGIDGFATNFKNTMISIFDIISNVFILVIKGLWSIRVHTIKIIGPLLNITLKATGVKK